MTATLWIDPDYGKGSAGCACALFCDAVLVDVWRERPDHYPTRHLPFGCMLDRVTYERPQADSRSYKFSPETLIRLTAEGAELAGMYAGMHRADLHRTTPREWKGSQAKPKMHARLWEALTPAERTLLGGDATKAAIDAAVRKGALNRWAPGDYYPKSFGTADLLDAACMGAIYHGRMK